MYKYSKYYKNVTNTTNATNLMSSISWGYVEKKTAKIQDKILILIH